MKTPAKWTRFALGFAGAILLFTADAFGGDDELKADFYKRLETSKSVVFVAQCGNPNARLARLFYDTGSSEWTLVEELWGVAVNLGALKIGEEGITDLETNGGVYSYRRVRNLLGELVASGFDVVTPFTVEKLHALKPRKDKCEYEE